MTARELYQKAADQGYEPANEKLKALPERKDDRVTVSTEETLQCISFSMIVPYTLISFAISK